MYFSESAFQGEYLEEIQTLIYDLEEDVVEVSDQNVSDLDPCCHTPIPGPTRLADPN